MAIDIREIELTEEQKRRVAELAEESGRSWKEVLNEQFGPAIESNDMKPYRVDEDRYIEDRDKWREYFRVWLSQQTSHNPNLDDSRDSIYP